MGVTIIQIVVYFVRVISAAINVIRIFFLSLIDIIGADVGVR